MLSKRSTIHMLNTGPEHDKARGHLFIILTNKCAENKQLMVSACTRVAKCDETCLVGKGDHPFFSVDSYIAYNKANIYDTAMLQKRISENIIKSKGELDEKIFALVAIGLTNSRYTPLFVKNYFEKNKHL